ncbi:MAG: CCA tRNA nucleotidyltransferase [bacterium]|nr:CCA tRNA nucleotidyltransferase [bacterium]
MGKPARFKFAWTDRSKLSEGAFSIVRKLKTSGFEALLAGGAVRDALLKRPLLEIDIATSATPAQIKRLFSKTIPTGEKHGTITVRLDKVSYEVTTFRIEGPYKDYRHPAKVKFVQNPEQDAKRRDFGVNALFYDPTAKEVIDYVNGIADISHKKIRFVGMADDRIREDALRMMRAVRFATALNFALEPRARKAIQNNAALIKKISTERIKQELDKIILSDRASIGLSLLDVVGLMEFILPELKACQGVRQPRNEHAEGDVYTHSLLALEKTDESYDVPTRYAVLFHDLGKAGTAKIRQGKITFYGHPDAGAEIAFRMMKRLKFSGQDTDKTVWLVRNHMVPNDFPNMRLSTRRKWGLNAFFADLLKVYKADAQASLSPAGEGHNNTRSYREGLKILKEIAAMPKLKKPILSGNEVMKILRVKPGPIVGKVLEILEEKKLANELRTKKQARLFLKQNKNEILLDKKSSTLYS